MAPTTPRIINLSQVSRENRRIIKSFYSFFFLSTISLLCFLFSLTKRKFNVVLMYAKLRFSSRSKSNRNHHVYSSTFLLRESFIVRLLKSMKYRLVDGSCRFPFEMVEEGGGSGGEASCLKGQVFPEKYFFLTARIREN